MDPLEPTPAQTTALTQRTILANSVATPTQVAAILAKVREGYPDATVEHLLATVYAAGDQGSSRLTSLPGEHNGVPLQAVMNAAQLTTTFRQFCMYFSKYYWNHLIRTNIAPANWVRNGHTMDTRFSAFDFFTGVLHPAARLPPGGLLRTPTDDEIKSQALNAHLAIARAQGDQNLTTAAEVQGRRIIETSAPPRITFS